MTIETPRLILRPFRESDAADLLEYRREQTVHCFADMRLRTPAEAAAEIRKLSEKDDAVFAVELKETGKVIGEIGAGAEPKGPHDEGPGDTYSPYWMLGAAWRRRGLAFEAARALFDWLFREKGARRIYAYTEDDNRPSQRLCEKLGMRREGLFLEFVSFVRAPDGTPVYENTIQYAVLKREWENRPDGAGADGVTIGRQDHDEH